MKQALMTFAAFLTATLARAEEAAAPAMGFKQVLETGGSLIIVLMVMSVIGLALVVYFFLSLRADHVIPPAFCRDVTDLIAQRKLREASTRCRDNGSPIALICGTALDYVLRTERPNPALLREIIEGEGGRQASQIQTQTQYLLDIAVIAPMIGLLGTVMGMLRAFNTVALDLAKARPMELAGGVSQALITTVAGLIVAIPAMIAYAYFRGRAANLISGLETTAANMASAMIEEKAE